jgi:hypothetical protein
MCALYHLSHTSSSVCSGNFGARVILFVQASLDHYFILPALAGMVGLYYHAQPFFPLWNGSLANIFLGWPRNFILPISASKVARITG